MFVGGVSEQGERNTAMSAVADWMRSMPSVQDIEWELKKAEAIRRWCLRDLSFGEGDRVRIKSPINTNNNWAHYREALAVGSLATVERIDFNPYSDNGRGAWHADVVLDREWSLGTWATGIRRYWHGPADETPEGFEPPSRYDTENYPNGRKHTFSIVVDHLERA